MFEHVISGLAPDQPPSLELFSQRHGDDKQKSPQTVSTGSKFQPGGTGTDPCKSYRCRDEPVPHKLSAKASC